MQYANRIRSITDSPTLAVAAKAKALKAQGVDVISLSAGQPDFPTPEHVKAAGIGAINKNITRYTANPGTPELRQAIADWMTHEIGVEYKPNQVLVSNGAKSAISIAILATINEGDEVIFALPYWVSYPEMARIAGGIPVIAQTTPESGFKLTPKLLDEAISPKTRMVLLNSPSNPTGVVTSQKELAELAEVLSKHPDIWILSDEIYSRLIFDGLEHHSIAAVAPNLANRAIVANGVSKSFSMTGWRIGWIVGSPELISSAAKIQGHLASCPSSIGQHATLKALTSPDDFLTSMVQTYQRRRDMFIELLADIHGIEPHKPDGAFYLFCNIGYWLGKRTPEGKTISSSCDFADYLLDKALVAGVPGGAFGMDDYFRFSFAVADDDIRRAIERISKAVEELS